MAPAMSEMSKLRVLAATAAVMASTNCTEFQPRPAPVAVDAVKLTAFGRTSGIKEKPKKPSDLWNALTLGGAMRKHEAEKAEFEESQKRAIGEQVRQAMSPAAAELSTCKTCSTEDEDKKASEHDDDEVKQVVADLVDRAIEDAIEQATTSEPKTVTPADDTVTVIPADETVTPADDEHDDEIQPDDEHDDEHDDDESRRGAIEALMHGEPGAQEAYRFAKGTKRVDSEEDFYDKVTAGKLSVAKLLEEKAAAGGKSESYMTLCGKVMLWVFGTVVFMLSILFGRVLCSRRNDEGESESEMEESDSEAEDEARSRAESMSP